MLGIPSDFDDRPEKGACSWMKTFRKLTFKFEFDSLCKRSPVFFNLRKIETVTVVWH